MIEFTKKTRGHGVSCISNLKNTGAVYRVFILIWTDDCDLWPVHWWSSTFLIRYDWLIGRYYNVERSIGFHGFHGSNDNQGKWMSHNELLINAIRALGNEVGHRQKWVMTQLTNPPLCGHCLENVCHWKLESPTACSLLSNIHNARSTFLFFTCAPHLVFLHRGVILS